MAIAQTTLLTIGLVLQLWLLFLIFRVRVAYEVALFPALIFFYLVRSSLLFALSRHIAQTSYAAIYSGLSLLDLLLQIALAAELALTILRSGSKSLLPRGLLIPVFFLLASALTGALVAFLPAHSPVPADRGTLFTGFLFLLLWAWSLSLRPTPPSTRLTPWRRSVLIGLAAIGASGILWQSAKAIAASHHNGHLFFIWSYGNAGVYLLVLLFWVLRCKPVTAAAVRLAQAARPRVEARGF